MKTRVAAIAAAVALGLTGCGNQPAPMADSGGALNGLQLNGAPGTPGYGTPGTSGYGAPGTPAYGAPGYGSTGYGAPGYGSPGTPGYGAPQAGNPQQQVQSLLSAVAQNFQRNTCLHAVVTVFVKNVQNGQTMSGDMDYWYQKPNSTALYVRDSSDTASVGTKLVWMGGSQVAVRTKFLGFWVNTSVSLTDSRILDVRGDSLADTSVTRMMNTLLDPQAQVSIAGSGTYMGQPVVQVNLVSRQSLPGVTSEQFTINTQTMVPVIRQMFSGQTLVYRLQLQQMTLNQPDPSAFTLNGTT